MLFRSCERTESPGPWEAHGGAARPRPARAGIRAAGAARQEVTLERLVLAWLPVATPAPAARASLPAALLRRHVSRPAQAAAGPRRRELPMVQDFLSVHKNGRASARER